MTRHAPTDLVLVDDDEIVHLFVQRRLRRTGLTMEAFTDPERALDWLRTHRPTVLLLDHRMPRLDGPALLDALGGPDAVAERVVLCTAGSNDPGLERLVGEPNLTIRNKAELLDRQRFLALLGLLEPSGPSGPSGPAPQCDGRAAPPDSNRASPGLPSTRSNGR